MAKTQINATYQVLAGSLTDTEVNASAALALSKLAESVIQADGGQAFTADQDMGSNKLTGLADGTAATDAATKGQIDAALSGLDWKDPVAVREMVGSSTIAGINGLSPTSGDAYIATDAGTPSAGSSDALAAGDITEFDGTSWKKIVTNSGGYPPSGTRALAAIQTALNGTIGLTDGTDDGKILDWDGTSLTPATETTPVEGNSLLVLEEGGVFASLGYVFDGAVPTGTWVQFTGVGQINAGAGLTKSGNTINAATANAALVINADNFEVKVDATAATIAVGGAGLQVADATSGYILTGQGAGTDTAFVAMSGDVAIVADGTTTIQNNAITEAKINNGAVTNGKLGADAVTGAKLDLKKETRTNSTSATWQLAGTPIDDDHLFLYKNGSMLTEGGSDDYTRSTDTITFADTPVTTDKMVAVYMIS